LALVTTSSVALAPFRRRLFLVPELFDVLVYWELRIPTLLFDSQGLATMWPGQAFPDRLHTHKTSRYCPVAPESTLAPSVLLFGRRPEAGNRGSIQARQAVSEAAAQLLRPRFVG